MFTFKRKYFALAILLFLVEVFIAVYVNDSFVRPYFGDFLVVILIYCFVKSFWNGNVVTAALSVLVFAYIVEISQYFKLVKFLGLEKSNLAKVVLGTSFAWADMLAYTLGIVFVLLIEKMVYLQSAKGKHKSKTTVQKS